MPKIKKSAKPSRLYYTAQRIKKRFFTTNHCGGKMVIEVNSWQWVELKTWRCTADSIGIEELALNRYAFGRFYALRNKYCSLTQAR